MSRALRIRVTARRPFLPLRHRPLPRSSCLYPLFQTYVTPNRSHNTPRPATNLRFVVRFLLPDQFGYGIIVCFTRSHAYPSARYLVFNYIDVVYPSHTSGTVLVLLLCKLKVVIPSFADSHYSDCAVL
jgi:hypothetical protein